METLANLESFVRSADTGSFSAAARLLALTPAAVSRNVAMLERNIGVRLFQRSTRKLSLTEAGEGFLASIGGNLEALQEAIRRLAREQDILQQLVLGYTYQEVADALGVSVNTVRFHIKGIYSKMAVRSRGEAVYEAARSSTPLPSTTSMSCCCWRASDTVPPGTGLATAVSAVW